MKTFPLPGGLALAALVHAGVLLSRIEVLDAQAFLACSALLAARGARLTGFLGPKRGAAAGVVGSSARSMPRAKAWQASLNSATA